MFMTHGPNRERQLSVGIRMGYISTPEGAVRMSAFKRAGEQEPWKAHEVLAGRGTTQQPDPQRQSEEVNASITAERAGRAASATTRRTARWARLQNSGETVWRYTCTRHGARNELPSACEDLHMDTRPDSKRRAERRGRAPSSPCT